MNTTFHDQTGFAVPLKHWEEMSQAEKQAAWEANQRPMFGIATSGYNKGLPIYRERAGVNHWRLPDGSQVWLRDNEVKPCSEIEYRAKRVQFLRAAFSVVALLSGECERHASRFHLCKHEHAGETLPETFTPFWARYEERGSL